MIGRMMTMDYHSTTIKEIISRNHKRTLASLLIELTYECNEKCKHCYVPNSWNGRTQLSLKCLKKIVNDTMEMGCFSFTLSGGEPLTWFDFINLYKYIWNKGGLISLFTNTLLISEEHLHLFSKLRPYAIEISLYSNNSEIHDQITGVKGSFNKTVKNIRLLKAKGIKLILKSPVMILNYKDIPNLYQWTKEEFGYHFRYDPHIIPNLNGEVYPLKLRVSPKEVLKIDRQIPSVVTQLQKEAQAIKRLAHNVNNYNAYDCYAGRTSLHIDPFGKVKLCGIDPNTFSIYDKSIRDIWDEDIASILELKRDENDSCINCNIRSMCSWCHSLGSLKSEDKSFACELAKLRFNEFS